MGSVPHGGFVARAAAVSLGANQTQECEVEHDMDIQITQQELGEIVYLQREIKQKTERLEEVTSNVKAMLFGHVPIEPGRFDAYLDYRRVRTPAWKEIVIDNLGQEFADKCWRETQSHPMCQVKIEEHAMFPSWNEGTDDDEKDE